jgi:hypothetical protein
MYIFFSVSLYIALHLFQTMKNMGNIKANQLYNPDERRNPPPANLEDTDRGSDLENYIRVSNSRQL